MNYEPSAGEDIHTTTRAMVLLANEHGEAVQTTFNDIPLYALPGDDPTALASHYSLEMEQRAIAYRLSSAYLQQQRDAAERQQQQDAALQAALATAPAIRLRDEEGWNRWVANNTDAYGSGVVRFAERWARIMQAKIQQGQSLDDCAHDASRIADTEGITGFMYGCAVGALAHCWESGEQLRRWHNLATQVSNEGEQANERPGVVLNPAVLTIKGEA